MYNDWNEKFSRGIQREKKGLADLKLKEIESGEQEEKRLKKTEQGIRDLWNNIQSTPSPFEGQRSRPRKKFSNYLRCEQWYEDLEHMFFHYATSFF